MFGSNICFANTYDILLQFMNISHWSYTHMYLFKLLMPMTCSVDSLKYFYICKPYLLFHIYDPLSTTFLAVLFGICKCLWTKTAIHKHFTLKLCSHVFICKILMPMKCSVGQLQIFHTCEPYLFFHTHDPLICPNLAVLLIFQMPFYCKW